MKLLLIEDNKQMAATIENKLKKQYVLDVAHTGDKGEYLSYVNEYDLILLDLNLPDIDGTEVCTRIRANGNTVPILAITGRTKLGDKVQTLDGGVDDYLTKPFQFEELKARIRALLRRKTQPLIITNKLTVANLTLDISSKSAHRAEMEINLRPKEFQLLEYLMRNQGMVVTRNQILEHAWETDTDPFTNTVDVHIRKLRDKIDKPFGTNLVKTVHGFGYMIKA
jgi:DNA-binding response OmpR family regulator